MLTIADIMSQDVPVIDRGATVADAIFFNANVWTAISHC